MFDPIATYRLQFNKGFTFKSLQQVLPYLHELGVKTIYASPIFKAVPGSGHGYDVTDPHQINPEIGTLEELLQISAHLKELGMNWVQDIVPNHMAFHHDNQWLMDVMEHGRDSAYADHFDILWDLPQLAGKLMVPFLGEPLADLIRDQKIMIVIRDGRLNLSYGEQYYPLNAPSVMTMLESKADAPQISRLIAILKKTMAERTSAKAELSGSLVDTDIKKHISLVLKAVNADPEKLNGIIEQQYYQLSFWRDSDRMINYRRFFTVNGLICLNIQHEAVFNEYHQFIKKLLDQGCFQGLRVDHIDGLADPKTYLDRLRALAGKNTYIVVEKILESGEQFPADWPVQGNTGYDHLGVINNLLTYTKSKPIFTSFYKELTGQNKSPMRAVPEKKAAILYDHMAGELDNLCYLFNSLGLARNKKRFSNEQLKATIAQFLIGCPVYRYYGNQLPLPAADIVAIKSIFRSIAADHPELKITASYLSRLFTGKTHPVSDQKSILKFYQRCMQFTGPLMAKGVEDTLMYTYDRFIAHNEVGDSPAEFGLSVKNFHALMITKQQRWPLSMNATATHDTKRGEDVRARLNVTSDAPDQWLALIRQWLHRHRELKASEAPDTNDEYLIYQTMLGIWPLPGEPADDLDERLGEYLTKALREAKTHTDWADQNTDYENGTIRFYKALLNDPSFGQDIQNYVCQIADAAVINSLTQLLLKCTCPGVPDIYQGCEGWDLSLVDPDNRRPVDFKNNAALLKRYRDMPVEELWQHRYTGAVKTWLTHKLLILRQNDTELFLNGRYVPLTVKGKYADHVIAFARCLKREWLVVAAPLHLAAITNEPESFDWADTRIILPDDAELQWVSVLHQNKTVFNKAIPIAGNFAPSPVGLWRSTRTHSGRGAGVIMHITSLPSPYGVGDLGPGARHFADFMTRAGQRLWQVLPINPTGPALNYSPYSGSSSMAGNTLLISPDDLVKEGLVTHDEATRCQLPPTTSADLAGASKLKARLFEQAYTRYKELRPVHLEKGFEEFKLKERYWLADFALYEVARSIHNGEPWYRWPDAFKRRDKNTLVTFKKQHARELDKAMWLQFIFHNQWSRLKTYVNHAGISFFGDLPFYISYDSADVWTHPELFDLNKDLDMAGVAGVPPDYFNADGQLWGMPVYNWAEHERTKFSWWVNRMKRNRDFFDVIRLDHFRAFHSYWRVPASEETAVNGQWLPGPGAAIFRVLEQELGSLPFIAEDLGEISEDVYRLRDEFKLPGMNVLQFAFGEDMPVSVHIPHNHISNSVTYTGTHDNNTLLGWFLNDSTLTERENLSHYLRTRTNSKNVNRLMAELCYSSVSDLAILPMQDILGLDQYARMNTPSSTNGNWLWRMEKEIDPAIAAALWRLVKRYNR